MKLGIPVDLVNQILGYLGTRPYQEVYQLIQGVQDAAKPQEPPKVEDGLGGD